MTELKGAQAEALRRCNNKPGFAYFMEQGLGKTLTSLRDFQAQVEAGRALRKVVLCPNSFKAGWAAEIEKHGLDFEPLLFESGSEVKWLRRRVAKGFDRPPVLMVNYEAARSTETREFITEYVGNRPCFISADESIQISTYNTAQTKAAIELAKMFDYRRVLSGKPIKEGPNDLWAQMRFIGHLDGMTYYPFRNAFCKMGGFKAKKVVGAMNEDILAERLDPVVFRATKAEWTDLPPKIYNIREYKLTPELVKMYNAMETDFVAWLDSETVVTVDAAITKYIKMAQIQCGFIIDEEGKVHNLVEPKKNPRLRAIREAIDTEIIGKVTVPYVNTHMLTMLMEAFADLNPTYIKGGMSQGEIEEQKHIFNTDRRSRLMFLQTRASKYGHTLLGLDNREDHCSAQAFAQNSYSLDDRSQIEDRSHRYGQLGETMDYFDFAGTPLDHKVVAGLQAKENIAQIILNSFGQGDKLI